ncbi:MAG: AmmeMemoRadiSam system protein A [Actinobacteria bacterium]|nr:AmmeMemoRadiSam system protein A [Actinomycetota bacterium]
MTEPLTDEELDILVAVAERSVWEVVAHHRPWRPVADGYPPALRAPGAAFVSLHRDGRLAGCIGVLTTDVPLVVTVADRASAAAVNDPRFRPVDPLDLPRLDVEVSVLTPSVPLPVESYAELLSTVRPGVDGITVHAGRHRATMLPTVWNDLIAPADFIAAVWRKAGLTPGDWPRGIEVQRYRTQTHGHSGRGVHAPAE